MRVLLDECLPRRLRHDLPGHAVRTVPEAGWAGKKNGDLLRVAGGIFEVFITIDASLAFQQDVAGLIALSARSNRLEALRPLMPRVREILATRPGPGTFHRVGE